MSELAWWHQRANHAQLSPEARLIRAEARAARPGEPTGELQRMLTMVRMHQPWRDETLYELAGFALAGLRHTLRRAKRLHEVSEWQFLEAVKRAAEATHGPIEFVPVRRRARVGRLDRTADPAIAEHLVTTMPLMSAVRTAFVQRVLAELEAEAKAIAGRASRDRRQLDVETYDRAIKMARGAGLSRREMAVFQLHLQGRGPAAVGRELGFSRTTAAVYLNRARVKIGRVA